MIDRNKCIGKKDAEEDERDTKPVVWMNVTANIEYKSQKRYSLQDNQTDEPASRMVELPSYCPDSDNQRDK